MGKKLGRQEILDIACGSALLGSGGGGPLELAGGFIDLILRLSPDGIELKDLEEIGDNEWGATLGGVGSNPSDENEVSPSVSVVSPPLFPNAFLESFASAMLEESPQNKTLSSEASGEVDFSIVREGLLTVFRLLEASVNQQFTYVLPIETGAISILIPLLLAALKKIPILDGDGAGRAVPMLGMSVYASRGITANPLAFSNLESPDKGQSLDLVIYTREDSFLEEFTRAIVGNPQFDSDCISLIATYPIDGRTLREKKPLVLGSITRSLQVGEVLRQAKESGKNPAEALLDFFNKNQDTPIAYLLFQGKITAVNTRNQGGFTRIILTLSNPDAEASLYSQNEILFIQQNSPERKPLAMAPDLICYLGETGVPRTNAESFQAGENLTIIGIKAPDELRQAQKIIASFSILIKKINQEYEGDYIPIENLQNDGI